MGNVLLRPIVIDGNLFKSARVVLSRRRYPYITGRDGTFTRRETYRGLKS